MFFHCKAGITSSPTHSWAMRTPTTNEPYDKQSPLKEMTENRMRVAQHDLHFLFNNRIAGVWHWRFDCFVFFAFCDIDNHSYDKHIPNTNRPKLFTSDLWTIHKRQLMTFYWKWSRISGHSGGFNNNSWTATDCRCNRGYVYRPTNAVSAGVTGRFSIIDVSTVPSSAEGMVTDWPFLRRWHSPLVFISVDVFEDGEYVCASFFSHCYSMSVWAAFEILCRDLIFSFAINFGGFGFLLSPFDSSTHMRSIRWGLWRDFFFVLVEILVEGMHKVLTRKQLKGLEFSVWLFNGFISMRNKNKNRMQRFVFLRRFSLWNVFKFGRIKNQLFQKRLNFYSNSK